MHQIDPWYLENSSVQSIARDCPSKVSTWCPREEGVIPSLTACRCYSLQARRKLSALRMHRLHAHWGGPKLSTDGRPSCIWRHWGISEREKRGVLRLYENCVTSIDPVAAMLIGATCGNAYKDLIGNQNLTEYPIPSLALNPARAGVYIVGYRLQLGVLERCGDEERLFGGGHRPIAGRGHGGQEDCKGTQTRYQISCGRREISPISR